jgi:hypothetical protein
VQSCTAEGVTVGQDPSTASDIARSEVAMGVGGENKELWDMDTTDNQTIKGKWGELDHDPG